MSSKGKLDKIPGSKKGYRSELEYFNLPETDISVTSCCHEKLLLSTNMNEQSGCVEFNYVGNKNQYVDLKESFLCVRGKVVKSDGGAVASGTDLSTANLLLASLFINAKVFFNGILVGDALNAYGYLGYLRALLGYSEGSKSTTLSSQLFFKDSAPSQASDTNTGYKQRKDNSRKCYIRNGWRFVLGRMSNGPLRSRWCRYSNSAYEERSKVLYLGCC